MAELGLYGGEIHLSGFNIKLCSRTGDVIEPMIKEQWFMHCDQINDDILRALSEQKVLHFVAFSFLDYLFDRFIEIG